MISLRLQHGSGYRHDREIIEGHRHAQNPNIFNAGVGLVLVAPPGYSLNHLKTIVIPVGGSVANQRYVGNYHELFDNEDEQPAPT